MTASWVQLAWGSPANSRPSEAKIDSMPLESTQYGRFLSASFSQVCIDFITDFESGFEQNNFMEEQTKVVGTKEWGMMVSDAEEAPHTNTGKMRTKLVELDENFS